MSPPGEKFNKVTEGRTSVVDLVLFISDSVEEGWWSYTGSYQTIDATHSLIGIVEGVGQLVHSIVGLAVAIETHSHGSAADKDKKKEERHHNIRPERIG